MKTIISKIGEKLGYTVTKETVDNEVVYSFRDEDNMICMEISERTGNYDILMWCDNLDLLKIREIDGLNYYYESDSRGDTVYFTLNESDESDHKDTIIGGVEADHTIYHVNVSSNNGFFPSTLLLKGETKKFLIYKKDYDSIVELIESGKLRTL